MRALNRILCITQPPSSFPIWWSARWEPTMAATSTWWPSPLLGGLSVNKSQKFQNQYEIDDNEWKITWITFDVMELRQKTGLQFEDWETHNEQWSWWIFLGLHWCWLHFCGSWWTCCLPAGLKCYVQLQSEEVDSFEPINQYCENLTCLTGVRVATSQMNGSNKTWVLMKAFVPMAVQT